MPTRRRALLASAGRAALGALLCGFAGPARGIGPATLFRVQQGRYAGGSWNPRPTAALALAQELRFRTSIELHLEPAEVPIESPRLFDQPFLLLFGQGEFGHFSRAQADNLGRFLELGGFVFVDNVGAAGPSAGFDRNLRAELKRILPGRELKALAPDHVLYRSFYRVELPAGRVLAVPYLEGLVLDDRLGLVYSRNDLSGAWARHAFGGALHDVIPGGEAQREQAYRLGVNLVVYALCLDYKDDQVHLDYLLHKRNWRVRKP